MREATIHRHATPLAPDTLSFTALIHSLTLRRSLNGSAVPFLPRQNHLSFKIHSKHRPSDLRLLLERVAVAEEEAFRITRQKYTCRVRRGGRTQAEKFSMRGRSYTAKVVDRDVGRWSGKRESTVEPLLLLQLLLLPVLSLSSGPAYLFLSLSLPPFLLRLLLYFCPFARFLLPQTTAAYLYPVFASRGSERGRFCVYSLLPFSLPLLCSSASTLWFSTLSLSLPLSLDTPSLSHPPSLCLYLKPWPIRVLAKTSTARHFAHEHREMRSMREAIPRLHHLSTRHRVPTGLYYMQHVASGYSR